MTVSAVVRPGRTVGRDDFDRRERGVVRDGAGRRVSNVSLKLDLAR